MSQDILLKMIKESEQNAQSFENNIPNIEKRIAKLQDEMDAIQNNYCSNIANELIDYLYNKYSMIDYVLQITPNFDNSINYNGIGNLTDFILMNRKYDNNDLTKPHFSGSGNTIIISGNVVDQFPEITTSEELQVMSFSTFGVLSENEVNGASYLHDQDTSSQTWTINHNLGSQYVLVSVYDDNNKIISPGEIIAIDSNNIIIQFSKQIIGKAIISTGYGTTGDGSSGTGGTSDPTYEPIPLKTIGFGKYDTELGYYTNLVFCNISEKIYDVLLDQTTITLSESILSDQNAIFWGGIKYNSPYDSNIIEFIEKWEYGHDLIVHPFDNTGTYGLKENINILQNAKNLMESNSDKYRSLPGALQSVLD
jgi:hypothetical protein